MTLRQSVHFLSILFLACNFRLFWVQSLGPFSPLIEINVSWIRYFWTPALPSCIETDSKSSCTDCTTSKFCQKILSPCPTFIPEYKLTIKVHFQRRFSHILLKLRWNPWFKTFLYIMARQKKQRQKFLQSIWLLSHKERQAAALHKICLVSKGANMCPISFLFIRDQEICLTIWLISRLMLAEAPKKRTRKHKCWN